MQDFLSKIRRIYNDNKLRIWEIVLFAVMLFAFSRIANNNIKEQRKINSINSNSTIAETTENVVKNEKTLSINENNTNTNLLNKFINYMNSADITSAYSMLSTDCKKYVYSNQNEFKTKYYDVIFNQKRSNNTSLYTANKTDNFATYKVIYEEDILSAGKENLDTAITDYITIDDKQNLNISNFIKSEILDEKYNDDKIEISIDSVQTYLDYEIYNITFYNNTSKKINWYSDSSSVYIEDYNGNKYELEEENLKRKFIAIDAGKSENYTLKYAKKYDVNNADINMKFDSIVINDEVSSATVEIKN